MLIAGVVLCTIAFVCGHRRNRAVTSFKDGIWPGGVIPYAVNHSYSGEYQRLFQLAMRHWMEHTCLAFVHYDPQVHEDFILFTQDKCGCCSHVGRKGGGGQFISIGEKCDKFGIVVHELGHVVGFWHEHTRPDRDKFVRILHENIQEGQEYNFDKARPNDINSLHETYDFHSIMHYARDTFARSEGLDTILPKGSFGPGQGPFIGQRVELSRGDIRQTKKLYHCPACFRTLVSSSGSLHSDGECTDFVWRILASEGQRIKLHLHVGAIFENESRECDETNTELLRIRSGPTLDSPIVTEVCQARNQTIRIEVHSPVALVELRTNRQFPLLSIGRFHALCGGLLEGSHGYLQSPGWPAEYAPGQQCSWMIRVAMGLRVALRFNHFQLEPQRNCMYDYLEVAEYRGAEMSQVLARLCGQNPPVSLVSNYSNELILTFVTDLSIQKQGFELEFVQEVNECEVGTHRCDQKCINEIGGYRCECEIGFSLHKDGFRCVRSCGGQLLEHNGQMSSPNWPEEYGPNQHCVWEVHAPDGYQVFLTVVKASLEGLHAECTYDYVLISPIQHNRSTMKLCGDFERPLYFRSQSNYLNVQFVSDSTVQKLGFTARYQFDKDECHQNVSGCSHACVNLLGSYQCTCPEGLVLSSDNRTCTSPSCSNQVNEPAGVIQSLNSNWSCSWHLITIPGHRFSLSFDFFDVDESQECNINNVMVYDGGNPTRAPLMAKLCGTSLPPVMISSGNELFIDAKVGDKSRKDHFQVKFVSECGGELIAETTSGFIYSHTGFGDSKYEKNTQCHWEIRKSDGSETSVIRLQFKSFNLEESENCDYDYLEWTDHKAADVGPRAVYRGRFCGTRVPPRIFALGDRVVLDFKTDQTAEEKGFVLEYGVVDLADTLTQAFQNETNNVERSRLVVED